MLYGLNVQNVIFERSLSGAFQKSGFTAVVVARTSCRKRRVFLPKFTVSTFHLFFLFPPCRLCIRTTRTQKHTSNATHKKIQMYSRISMRNPSKVCGKTFLSMSAGGTVSTFEASNKFRKKTPFPNTVCECRVETKKSKNTSDARQR